VQTRLTQSRSHHHLLSSEPYRCPRLREAATTLCATGGQRVRTATAKENEVERKVQLDRLQSGTSGQ